MSHGTKSVVAEVCAANERYARSFDHGSLPARPARAFAVLTCMDARIDPAKALGLAEGDAHVIRNAGGIASDDAIRSLVISQLLLGTREVIVIGHTDCETATFTNVAESVRASVRRIRETPLLPDDYGVAGLLYDVQTGRLERVSETALAALDLRAHELPS